MKIKVKRWFIEKAVQAVLRTGDVVGSYKGWKLWIPKSQIA